MGEGRKKRNVKTASDTNQGPQSAIRGDGDGNGEMGNGDGDGLALFASLFDDASGSRTVLDLILEHERTCRTILKNIRERHTSDEYELVNKKAQMLFDEAASWSLLWYLRREVDANGLFQPQTTLKAYPSAAADRSAELCLQITQWLQGLAFKALDLDNKKQGESLFEEIWTLLRAGRLQPRDLSALLQKLHSRMRGFTEIVVQHFSLVALILLQNPVIQYMKLSHGNAVSSNGKSR